jgi:salicylate hydroxylase
MAMEDAVCLAVTADEADGDFAAAFGRYQALRLVRTARVQLSAVMMGHMFHADGIARLVRNEIYSDHTPQSYNEALDWIYRAPDYIVAANLKAPKRKSPAGRKRAGAPGSRAKAKKRTVAKHRR